MLIVIGKVVSAVGSIMTFIPTLIGGISSIGGGLSALWGILAANPVTLVIAAIAALIAIFVALWNNCEGFREFWINLWNVTDLIAFHTVETTVCITFSTVVMISL